jgi:hypothetical protein
MSHFTDSKSAQDLLQGPFLFLNPWVKKPFLHQDFIRTLGSSYKENAYEFLFYHLVKSLKLKSIVEIGVLEGFSLLSMAQALKDLGGGEIVGHDLFEDYQYRHERMENVKKRIEQLELNQFCRIKRADAFSVVQNYSSIDLLHVDISNNGETIETLFHQWQKKVNKVMVFEGGGADRDQVEWMIKYNKPKIRPVLEKLAKSQNDFAIYVWDAYPSLTIFLKK